MMTCPALAASPGCRHMRKREERWLCMYVCNVPGYVKVEVFHIVTCCVDTVSDTESRAVYHAQPIGSMQS